MSTASSLLESIWEVLRKTFTIWLVCSLQLLERLQTLHFEDQAAAQRHGSVLRGMLQLSSPTPLSRTGVMKHGPHVLFLSLYLMRLSSPPAQCHIFLFFFPHEELKLFCTCLFRKTQTHNAKFPFFSVPYHMFRSSTQPFTTISHRGWQQQKAVSQWSLMIINKWAAQLQRSRNTIIFEEQLHHHVIIEKGFNTWYATCWNTERLWHILIRVFALGRIPYNQYPFSIQPHATMGFCGNFISTTQNRRKKSRSNVPGYNFSILCKLTVAKTWNPNSYK